MHIHMYTASCHASSENSRSSSSMGYLEPRPPAQPPANGEKVFSPKDIQKRLMDKVVSLSTTNPVPESEDVVERAESGGSASAISTSHSSQSLNSNNGSSKGISFASIFKRCSCQQTQIGHLMSYCDFMGKCCSLCCEHSIDECVHTFLCLSDGCRTECHWLGT